MGSHTEREKILARGAVTTYSGYRFLYCFLFQTEIRDLNVSTSLQIENVRLLSDTMKSWLNQVVREYSTAVAKKRKDKAPLINRSEDIC